MRLRCLAVPIHKTPRLVILLPSRRWYCSPISILSSCLICSFTLSDWRISLANLERFVLFSSSNSNCVGTSSHWKAPFSAVFSLFSLPRLSHSLPWFCCHIPLSNVCRQLLSDSTSQWTPLLLAIQFPLLGLVRDLHPLDNAHAERTNKEALSGLPYMESAVCVCMTGCWRIILCCPTARWFLCRKMIFENSVFTLQKFLYIW